MNIDMGWLKTNKLNDYDKSSYCSAFEGDVFETSIFHSSTSLNIEEFELNHAKAGEFQKGSEGIFFYASPENNNKAIYSAHHHAHANLLCGVRPKHISDELEEYAVYECRIKPHATVIDLNLPAPLKVVKFLRQILPISQRLKINRSNAYSFVDELITGSRIAKFRTLGIDVIVNYEGPDKVYGNVIVVTDPSVIKIKSSDTWNIKERERLGSIMNLPNSNFS